MSLTEELKVLECPMNWGLPEDAVSVDCTKKKVLEKLEYDADEDGSSLWQKVTQCLVMALVEYNSKQSESEVMGKYLDMIDNILKEEKLDALVKRHAQTIEYVTKAMRAHYYHKQKEDDKVKSCLSSIKPFEELTKQDQAGCYALKSCCFMEFAPDGFAEALEAIKKALELDLEEIEWSFLKGKCLARWRRRRMVSEKPDNIVEELSSLGTAARSPNASPYHLVFCGQSLLEYSQYAISVKKDPETSWAYKKTCVEMLRRAAEMGENNGTILVRVAKGLMHLYDCGIEDLLERSVFRSLELMPTSGFVKAVTGEWFMVRKKDMDAAIPYLRSAARDHHIFSSFRNLAHILYLYKSGKELEEEMEYLWNSFKDIPSDRLRALKPLAAYYFFVNYDIFKAIFYWKEWMIKGTNEDSDGNARSPMFIFCHDLTKALVGEVNCILDDPRSKLTSDEEDELRSFLDFAMETRPDLDVHEIRVTRDATFRDCVLKCKDHERKKILMERYNIWPDNSRYNNRSDNSRYDSRPNNSRYNSRSDSSGYNSRSDNSRWSDNSRYDSRSDNSRYDSRSDNSRYDSRSDNSRWSDNSRYDSRSDSSRYDSRSDSSRYDGRPETSRHNSEPERSDYNLKPEGYFKKESRF